MVLFGAVGFAKATNFGGPKDAGRHCDTSLQSQCVANDGTHLVCITAVTAAHRNAIINKIGHYNSMPFMYSAENPQPCSNVDDVIAKDVNLPGTRAIAWTKCASGATYGGSESPLPGTRWCKAQEYIWNVAFDYLINSDTNKQGIACHELGHTLGLRHRSAGNSSCMVSSVSDPTPYINPWTNTDGHDQAHLDARYNEP